MGLPITISSHEEPEMSAMYIKEVGVFDPVSSFVMNHIFSSRGQVIFLDIGCFTGYHLAVAAISGAAEIHAFDPFSINSVKACETKNVNRFDYTVNVYNYILGDHDYTTEWCSPLDNLAFSIQSNCPDPEDLYFDHYYSQTVKVVDMKKWIESNLVNLLIPTSITELLIRIAISEGFEESILTSQMDLWQHQ